jgi:hypothetical protein
MELTQTTPSSNWTVTHNLDTLQPAVDVWVDDGGITTAILPKQIQTTNANTLNINFSIPMSGTAVVNKEATQSYTHNQSSTSNEWNILHNFGSKFVNIEVMVQYNGVLESITPQNITSINDNQIKVYFSTPMMGLARVSK